MGQAGRAQAQGRYLERRSGRFERPIPNGEARESAGCKAGANRPRAAFIGLRGY